MNLNNPPRLHVLRHANGDDFSLKGVSSRVTEITVVAEVTEREVHTPMFRRALEEVLPKHNLTAFDTVVFVKRELFDENADYLLSVEAILGGKWAMAGGAYAVTSNGIWGRQYTRVPLSIHDRIEA